MKSDNQLSTFFEGLYFTNVYDYSMFFLKIDLLTFSHFPWTTCDSLYVLCYYRMLTDKRKFGPLITLTEISKLRSNIHMLKQQGQNTISLFQSLWE